MPRSVAPNPGDLQEMAKHVMYEVEAFRNGFHRWSQLSQSDPDWNSVLENSLLHFRVLREFFLTKCPEKSDDVVAADYADPSSTWQPKASSILKITKDDVDKRLAHLTTRRIAKPPIEWQVAEMEGAIEELVAQFKGCLPPAAATWFQNLAPRLGRSFGVGAVSNSTQS